LIYVVRIDLRFVGLEIDHNINVYICHGLGNAVRAALMVFGGQDTGGTEGPGSGEDLFVVCGNEDLGWQLGLTGLLIGMLDEVFAGI
jgi:hypothetical protein